MAKGDKLSEKEERFCLNYIKNAGNGTKAVKEAGYDVTDGSAKTIASRLLTKVDVQARLEELRTPNRAKKVLSIDERKELLTKIALSEDTRPNDAIKAMDILNRMDALYLQRQEIQGAVPVVIHDNVSE